MTLNSTIDVFKGGAVCLGTNVVCDGFIDNYSYRVQTHVHHDHMEDFETSKGRQYLFMSPETFALLDAYFDADLPYRDNFHQVERGSRYELEDGWNLTLLPSNHMLGSCQVALESPNGLRIGYSGDFGWPIEQVIQVDELVVDSTYGSLRSVRNYSQAEAEDCLLELVCQRLRNGSVHITAYYGTIERVLRVIEGRIGVPILASDTLMREVEVYQRYGAVAGDLTPLDSDDGRSAIKARSYVRLYSRSDGFGNEPITDTTITCSAYMTKPDHPKMEFSERAYSVAMSNHADFRETLKYIEATGARKVVTDNTRTHGIDLANAINERFPGVRARPSTNKPAPRWR